MGALLAVLSSVAWGSADFGGGMLSRRISAFASVLYSQGTAMVAVLVVTAFLGGFSISRSLLWAVGAGIVGPLALGLYYRALAIGPMGIVGPVSATSGAVPVVVGLLLGERISPIRLIGLVGCVVGVAIVSGLRLRGFAHANIRSVSYAAVSAVGFGFVFTAIAQSAHHGILATLAVQRVTNIVVLLILAVIRRPQLKADKTALLFLGLVGLLDIGANALFAASSQLGQLALVGALGALYPVTTTALASIFAKEKLTRPQLFGALVTMASVILASS
ncbi:MAG: DMT family transporter [Acidimicrobiaceae bacterium]|nr:DMT family transporter [Acidimicrobiaceae bacterium]